MQYTFQIQLKVKGRSQQLKNSTLFKSFGALKLEPQVKCWVLIILYNIVEEPEPQGAAQFLEPNFMPSTRIVFKRHKI
jgi:hypothetical protein